MRTVRGCVYLLAFAFAVLLMPRPSSAQISVGLSVRIAPPALPVYEQPFCPGPGYLWTPGYWAYGPDGYYWVPGTWVLAPRVGFLWTPGYWGWGDGVYLWHAGYWGPHVGFYGGVNYGFGYGGVGFVGGEWRGGEFFYNRSVSRVNVTIIHNTYNRTVVVRNVNRVSYNGGRGGLNARPSRQEQAYAREQRVAPTSEQVQHRDAAGRNRAFLNSVNHGRPAVAATQRPGEFNGRGNGGFHPPSNENRNNRGGNNARQQESRPNQQRNENNSRQQEARPQQAARPNQQRNENNGRQQEARPNRQNEPRANQNNRSQKENNRPQKENDKGRGRNDGHR